MIKLAINKVAVIFMLIIMITMIGIYSYFKIPRESSPDITIPYLIVTTIYPGVSPADIETLITDPLEKKFKGLDDLKKITSSSGESYSVVQLEFDTNIDIDDALQKVRDKVDLVKPELPEDAEDPEVMELNFSDLPIMVVNISGPAGLVRLKEIADDLEDDLESVKGILRVDVAGGREKEVQVLVDSKKLKKYRITLDQVLNTLKYENINMPGGTIDIASSKYLVRVPSEYQSISEIKNTVITAKFFKIIRIKDIADVKFTFKDKESNSRINQVDSVSLSIVKKAGENLIHTADTVKKIVNATNFPPGTKVEFLGDMSEEVIQMVKELESSLISGLVFVVLVLMFFMGFRNSIIVGLAIPFSFLIAISFMFSFGMTLNFVILFSLILALGMLVDNAIVVVENIYRLMQEGYSRKEAAIIGTSEVSTPILASTATTLFAFFSMFFWPGLIGSFMSFLPKTLVITLTASYFVAMIINPVLSSKFMILGKSRKKKSFSNHIIENKNSHSKQDNRIIRTYKSLLVTILKESKLQFLVVVLLIIAFFFSIMSFAFMKVEFFPDTVPDKFYIYVNAPPGTTLETTDAIVSKIEKRLSIMTNIKRYVANVGSEGAGTGFSSSQTNPNKAQIVIDLKDKEDLSEDPFTILKKLREMVSDIPGATFEIDRPKEGPPAGSPVDVRIIGKEFKVLKELSIKIQDIMAKIDGIVDIRDDYEEGRPEIHIDIDREKASLLGLNTTQIASTVRTAINGTEATTYRYDNEEYDIIVQLKKDQRNSINLIKQIEIASTQGFIPLESVANVNTGGGLSNIVHYELDRLITVKADVSDKLSGPQATLLIQEEIKKLSFPNGYRVEYGGENEMLTESFDFLMFASLLSGLLIYLVLVAQFNSFVYPLIITTTFIMAIIGVAVGLNITGNPFGLMAFVGMISLLGIVVNNAIVLLDYILHLKARGHDLIEAVIEAGITRFRPVMLTTITTILGLIPLTFGINFSIMPPFIIFAPNNNTSFWGPMGSVVIFGLVIATFFTLIIIPTIFYLVDSLRTRIMNSFKHLDA